MAHVEDVDGDGLPDLVVQVETQSLAPEPFQDGFAILTAEAAERQKIEGKDEIVIVPDRE